MSRALTAGELVNIRSNGQTSDVYLGIWIPETVFAAQINETFTTHDAIVQLTYDNVTTGAYTDIIEGMTVYIGSSAGLYDVGRARVRKTPTSSILYIGETSEINFADDQYITVVKEFNLWTRQPYVDSSNELFMDYDIDYSDQHTDLNPAALAGSTITPLWLTGASVTFSPAASDSYCIGSSISSYLWSVDGGAVVNETTATPTFTFTAAGQYLITLTVTAANAKTSTAYRYIIVYDSDNMPYLPQMQNCNSTGMGWSYQVKLYDDVSDVPPQALSVLFTKDWYDQTEVEIGARTESANVLAVGWIDQETILVDEEHGSVTFSAYSAEYWLNKLASFPAVFEYVSTATTWAEIDDMTVDMAAFSLLYWRSTLPTVCDLNITDDTRLAPALGGTGATLYEQLTNIYDEILTDAKCDRYSALHCAIDSQKLPESDRSSIPVVMDITQQDYVDAYEVQEVNAPDVSQVEMSGVYFDGTTSEPLFSQASGTILTRFGRSMTHDDILFTGQAQANSLAGLIYNIHTNKYPKVRLVFANGLKVADIAPLQYFTISLAAADNLGGITWTTLKMIPRRLSYSHNSNSGFLQLTVELEAYIEDGLSVTVTRPQTPLSNFAPGTDFDLDGFSLEPFDLFGESQDDIAQDPVIPDGACRNNTAAASNGPYDLWLSGTQYSNSSKSFTGTMRCYIRSSSHTNKSTVVINGTWQTLDGAGAYQDDDVDDTWYEVYAIDSAGLRVAQAAKAAITTPNSRTFTFSPPTSVQIAAIEIALDNDGETLTNNTDPEHQTNPGSGTSVVSETSSFFPYEGGYGGSSTTQWSRTGTTRTFTEDWVFDFTVAEYLDISWNITASMWNDSSQVSWTGTGQTSSEESGSFPIRSESGAEIRFEPRWQDQTEGDLTGTVIFTVYVVPAAKHRLIYNNVQVYNICSIYEEV
jgi:hypothetical protein